MLDWCADHDSELFLFDMAKPFTKVFKDIYTVTDLSWFEKLFLCEICSLHKNGGCNSSNKYLAEVFGVKSQAICRAVNRLVKNGYLQDKKLNENYHIPTKKCNELLQLDVTERYKNSNEMLQQSNESLQTHLINNNKTINKKEDKKASALEKSKKQNQHRQKIGPSAQEQMYAIMATVNEVHLESIMSKSESKDLLNLFHEIKKHLQGKKKKEGFANFGVSQIEIIQHFKSFCTGLDDFVKEKRFTTKYLFHNYIKLQKDVYMNQSGNKAKITVDTSRILKRE